MKKYLLGLKKLTADPWIKWSLLIVGTIILLGIIGFLFIIYGGRLVVDEKKLVLPATTIVETDDGTLVGKLYEENRELVSIDQVPTHVQNAFIAIEDVRFFDHAGVDFQSVMRAVYRDIIALDKVEGASTITQQLAKNLFLTNDKTFMRKTKEVMASIYLERHFSKKEILELYVNKVYFAHGIHGVGTASNYYFNKPVEELTVSEGAMLAGLVKAPNNYSPYIDEDNAKDRRDIVLSQMGKAGMLETEEMLTLQGNTLGITEQATEEKPWLDDYLDIVIREAADTYQLTTAELKRGGYRITVHLNEGAQQIAYETLQNEAYYSGSQPNVEVAFVLMEQETGELEAVIGGRDFQIGDYQRALVKRQPGSVMKPLAVYGPAMMDDYQPYHFLEDIAQEYDGYIATNVDGQYSQEVTMYEAIQDSKNAPAVWLLDQIGIPYSKEYLKEMQIALEDDGLAMALGGLETGITPMQVVQGYRTFIHDGAFIEAHAIAAIKDRNGEIIGESDTEETAIFSKQVAWNMVSMLENVVENGTAQSGSYQKALAGKTGSTQHPAVEGQVKDAWFAGITPEYVTALWMGYDQTDEEHYLTEGSAAPTRATKAILASIDQQQELARSFMKPSGVEELEDPITLPTTTNLEGSYKIGGWSLVQGELNWEVPADDRVMYHIYQVTDSGDNKIGEVTGKGEFLLTDVSLFQSSTYYIVPYNKLTKKEGEPSNQITLSFGR
ncbi:transglycosylase domain-containing protein [Paraliobacillus sediminis]|uniref:transglycosylase domain-containing protein n=1 Tax=Paraliobacillus sediminis TaxID=1885916 RepID=UPI000E3CB48B|nr:PBP1A family penicillin-binding protein [Paraliobacillus sediminis]